MLRLPSISLTPAPYDMSSPTPLTVHHTGTIPAPSPGTRLRLHPQSSTPGAASRTSIISSSAKGWSPLNITKRDGTASPLRSPQHTPDPTSAGLLAPDTASPRRSSSSFKHVSKNSLVSNSPFKSPTTVQGQQAAGIYEANRDKSVIHERRAPARALGASPEKATGVSSTPKAAIGLGIGIGRPVSQPRSASKTRTPSGSGTGSALHGTRRVSSERRTASVERRPSSERKTSGMKENDSPDARSSGKRAPRSSMGLKGLERNAYVSKSPFLSVRRVPSSERRDSPSQHSPKSGGGLVEKDDVFGSPSSSPTYNGNSIGRRRSSGGRSSSSPSKHLMPGSNSSPTPSPPRGVQAISMAPGSGINGPSPLGFNSTIPHRDGPSSIAATKPLAPPTPSHMATPQRSSMTPSRRIRGPREASDGLVDSPSKQPKTVTFQAIPDVKEFEPASVEGSVDGSFDVDSAGEHEGDSIDSVDLDAEISKLRITNPDASSRSPSPETVEESDMGHANPEESTTADFVNTLIEEGLFSPPQGQSPAFADQPTFSIPPPLPTDDKAPALSTPSLGESIRATPILGVVSGNDRATMPEVDEVGIPYGRTHHAELAAAAHATVHHDKPIAQPDLPQQSDEKLLFNGNARYSDPWSTAPISPRPDQSTFSPSRQPPQQLRAPAPSAVPNVTPHARQDGPMPDPFITLQTATKVLSPPMQSKSGERDEDGIPLGRSSHHERMMAARQLATQGLGLGMPRSPAVSDGLSSATSQMGLPTPREPVKLAPVTSKPEGERAEMNCEKAPKPEGEVEDEEGLFDVSFGSKNEELEEKVDKRWSAPAPVARRPPMVEALDLPPPVASPMKEENASLHPQPTAKEKSRFSLPPIGFTSPFFSQSAKVATPLSPASESGSSAHSEELNTDSPRSHPSPVIRGNETAGKTSVERPLTPPPKIQDGQAKIESPHRLPSFDFEEITLESVGQSQMRVARVVSPKKAASGAIDASTPSSSNVTGSSSTSTVPRLDANSAAVTSPVAKTTQLALASSSSTDFGGKGSGSDSTNTRVRARISRDAIRETVNQRLADGSISRRGSTQALNLGKTSFYADLAPTPPRPVSIAFPPRHSEKSLPLPPSPSHLRAGAATQMGRAHTTDTNATGRKVSSREWNDESESDSAYVGKRPGGHHRPLSQTQTAHEALKASERDGLIGEPKSALDRIIAQGDGARLGDSTSSNSTAILKPASNVGPPVPAKEGPTATMSRGGSSTALLDSTTGAENSASSGAASGAEGKMAMQAREEAIVAKRREKEGRIASNGSVGSVGSRRSRRSMSMSDAQQFDEMRKAGGRKPRLTLGIKDDDVSILDAFNEESAHIGDNRGYKVKERAVVKASYGPIGHGRSGDVHAGKGWRQLRRASDMNEHNKQLKELRAREAETGKASGTIFVKVLGIEQLAVPIPDQPTYFCITLDNGIDYIRTPYSVLVDGAKVNQEFSLVEHAGFEFSLSLDVRSDPHVLKAIHEKRSSSGSSSVAPGSAKASSLGQSTALAPPMQAKTSSGFKGFFGVSPRKKRPESMFSRSGTPVQSAQAALRRATPSIADFFANEVINSGAGGANGNAAGKAKSFPIAKTHVAFKPIAKQCEAKVLEIRYPMFSMVRDGAGAGATSPTTLTAPSDSANGASPANGRKQVAKITLQILRLPPLAGLQPEEMPGCIDDALRGIRHHGWWGCEYHEGVLTQSGGDCALRPKRRMYKLIGGNLVAINEVTKKEVTTIDLRKVVAVVDLNADDAPISAALGASTGPGNKRAGSPVSRMTMRLRDDDEQVRPRSFRLEFGEDEGDAIDFWADKDEDKEMWLNTLRGLVGKIPSNPLWAEMLARKQQEARERAAIKKMGSSTSLKKKAERDRQRESVGGAAMMSPPRKK